MSKISTYEVAPVPKLADKLIGTSVGGEIEDVTYNFTLQELLEVFLPVIPANNLQGILDYGNTATQDINLFGTITTTYLDVTDTATFLNSYFVGDTYIQGGLFDSEDSIGLAGQVLTSTGEFVEWVTLPPIFTPNLQQVLEEGNTSTIGIVLTAGLEATDVDTNTATINTNITIDGTITDGDAGVGVAGSVLSSTVTGVKWVALPVYSATSPLLFNSATGVFSIQQATNYQSGYLSAADWITFDGKQNAGNYITALTGQATASGPGSATVTLSNSAVIGKVLTGFNPIAGTINAADSILTAFGKTQSQINALLGGVQYQGTWNASANLPVLTSSVGVQGHYYVVNVAGNTNLNGITDWKIGDWAIFSESVWQKVDNTESVSSVNGFTGAVSLTTDDIPEGLTNLYFLNSRARAALSFLPGSGAYDNTSGAITIPTDNNQILNGAGYITYGSLSASNPLVYNNLTGAFSIPKATSLVDGYLSAADWSTFNGKQNYLGGTGLVKSTAGTISYITDNSSNWNTAYDRSIISAAVTGTTTKTLTLNEQDGGTITASWTDLDTGLTSVGVSMPGAFTVTNSPLTSNGTIAITGAGTSLQYIDGTGALQTFPGLTGFVPYTGATTNVDLGEFGISAGYFQADLTPTGALQVGRMQWNSTDGTMDLRLMGNNVTLQIGQENVTRVVNKTGIDLLEANYQVVRVRKVAEGGAQGQRLAVVLAQGNNENNSTEVIGLVTETILSNQEGFVTAFGEVKNINTTGSLQGETWVDGDILYLSDTVPGQLTKVRPIAPNHAVIVGYVTYAHVNNGKIYMAIDTGYELGELHNVYAPSPTANQSIYWNVANSRYQLNTIGGILGYTPADAATTISTTAPLQGGGDLSANRTFSITQSGASTDGYLSSTDWNTFNNKQPAGSYVPTSRQLTINGTAYDLSADRVWSVGTVTSVAALTLGTTGTDLSSSVADGTTTPVITLNVPTASAANRGALSAADWSTFNTKVGSVTASSPLASSGGATPNITIQQSSGSQDGYLSSTDWTTFNSKQAAGNYITSLTGEATASGPGAAAVTLNNASVTGKVLTGVNITGGTVQATDTMLTAFGKLQNQINGLIGSTIYQGTWNASTNTPALASGVGVRGYYYIVSVAGTTNLDGITDWFVGDWAIFDGTAWQQVDNTDAVVSVNGQTGAVSLTTDNISEGSTNLYYLDSRARGALSFTAGSGAYNSTTGVITIPTNTSQLTNGANFITLASLSGTAPIQYNNTTGAISITQSGTAANGFLSSTDWNTFNNKLSTATAAATYVPYVGATANLDMGTGVFGINTGRFLLFTKNGAAGIGNSAYVGFLNATATDGVYAQLNASNNLGFYGMTSSVGTAQVAYISRAGDFGGNSFIKTGGTSSQYLMADGSVSTLTNPVTGTGTINTLAKFTATGSTIGNSLFTDNGTNGALGGTNYSSGTNVRTFNITAPQYAGIGFWTDSGYTGDIFSYFSSGNLIIQSDPNNILSNSNIILSADGANIATFNNINVTLTKPLIGTSATFSGNGNGVTLNAVTGTTNTQFKVANTSGDNYFGVAASDGGSVFAGTSAYSSYLGANNARSLHFATNGVVRQTIDSTGAATFSSSLGANGIMSLGDDGTFGSTYKTLGLTGNTNGSHRIFAGTADNMYLAAATSRGIYLCTNGNVTPRLTVDTNGNVGIGTTSPNKQSFTNALTINSASTNVGLELSLADAAGFDIFYNSSLDVFLTNRTNGAMAFRTNATERMRIASNGYIGIGTNNPTSPLYVVAQSDSVGGDGIRLGNNGINRIWNTRFGTNTDLSYNLDFYDGSTWSNRLKLTYTGNLLIGTTGISGGGALQVQGNVNINGVFQINGVTIGGGGGSGVTGSGTTGYHSRWTGSTSLGNSVIYDDGTNASIGTTSPQGLLTLKVSATNTPSLAFKNESGGPSSAISNYPSAVQTYTVIGTNTYVTNTANLARFSTSYAGSYIAFDEGTMVFGSGTASETPSGRMFLSPAGLFTVNNSIRTQNYGLVRASLFRGGLYTYDAVAGTGTDYGLTLFAEGGSGGGNIYFCPGSATKVMTVETTGAMYMTRIASNLTFADSVGGMYVRQNGSISGLKEELRIFGNTIAFYSHLGSRYVSITEGGSMLIGTSTDAGYKLDVNGGARIQGNLRLQGSSVDSPILTIVGVTNTLITMGDSTSATTDIGIIQIRNGGTPVIQLDAGSGTNSYFNTGGGLLVNTIVDAGAGYKLQVNGSMLMTYTNFFNFRGSSGAGDVLVDNSGSTLRITGNVTVAGSVTATGGFFDTSDSRLKIVIKDYNQAKGIEKVAAKFYVKNGRRELGYFAQDLQEILPSAVAEGADGFLTLSYSQVHTAKIAVIEDEVTILKNRVSDLESKLLKYEA